MASITPNFSSSEQPTLTSCVVKVWGKSLNSSTMVRPEFLRICRVSKAAKKALAIDDTATEFLRDIWRAVGGDHTLLTNVRMTGAGDLQSVFAVSDLAAASIGAASLAIAELIGSNTGRAPGSGTGFI